MGCDSETDLEAVSVDRANSEKSDAKNNSTKNSVGSNPSPTNVDPLRKPISSGASSPRLTEDGSDPGGPGVLSERAGEPAQPAAASASSELAERLPIPPRRPQSPTRRLAANSSAAATSDELSALVEHVRSLQRYFQDWSSEHEVLVAAAAPQLESGPQMSALAVRRMQSAGTRKMLSAALRRANFDAMDNVDRMRSNISGCSNPSGRASPTSNNTLNKLKLVTEPGMSHSHTVYDRPVGAGGRAGHRLFPRVSRTRAQVPIVTMRDRIRSHANSFRQIFSDVSSALTPATPGGGGSSTNDSLAPAQGNSLQKRFKRIVMSKKFEFFCAIVILFNAAAMAYTADYAIHHLDAPDDPSVAWLEPAFAAFYTLELILRVGAYGKKFVTSHEWAWNMFDLILVASAVYDQAMALSHSTKGPMNPTFLRVVRIMKIAKLLRMIRLMRMFRELRLMLGSIVGSVKSMVWAIIVIVIITYMFGVCFLQAATAFLLDEQGTVDPDTKADILMHWGSVDRAMLSLYLSGTSGESWRVIAEPLKAVGGIFYSLFLVYIAFFMFVIVNTLTSLFLENTMQNAEKDRQVMVQLAIAQKNQYITLIEDLFARFDMDCSGELEFSELMESMKDPRMVAFASSLDIEATDVAQFFGILSDSGRHAVDIDTFVSGCMKLKGQARSIDLIGLVHFQKRTQEENNRLLQMCASGIQAILEAIQPQE